MGQDWTEGIHFNTEMFTLSSPYPHLLIDGPIANPSPPPTKAVNLVDKGGGGKEEVGDTWELARDSKG